MRWGKQLKEKSQKGLAKNPTSKFYKNVTIFVVYYYHTLRVLQKVLVHKLVLNHLLYRYFLKYRLALVAQ
jgi:type II restriction/modification system DNA methylase subunit YeeA